VVRARSASACLALPSALTISADAISIDPCVSSAPAFIRSSARVAASISSWKGLLRRSNSASRSANSRYTLRCTSAAARTSCGGGGSGGGGKTRKHALHCSSGPYRLPRQVSVHLVLRIVLVRHILAGQVDTTDERVQRADNQGPRG
jgi:hypothetical protein